MQANKWQPDFFRSKIRRVFKEGNLVIDIGGGLRIDPKRNNRFDASMEWLVPLAQKVDYQVLDRVADYNPDLVGDIHNLPLADESVDAVICISVLEHVEDPLRAAREMHRVVKKGGYVFVYVPFLYYYHAENGYYQDYWRFTKDSLVVMFKDFSSMECMAVRGACEAWIKLSPLGRSPLLCKAAHVLDLIFGKMTSNQVSGYHVFLIK